jgi:hypothetical protein
MDYIRCKESCNKMDRVVFNNGITRRSPSVDSYPIAPSSIVASSMAGVSSAVSFKVLSLSLLLLLMLSMLLSILLLMLLMLSLILLVLLMLSLILLILLPLTKSPTSLVLTIHGVL